MLQEKRICVGKVLKTTRKIYDVAVNDSIIPCVIRGKVTLEDSEYSSVRTGDNVKVLLVSDSEGIIQEILPRETILSRNIESRVYKEHIVAANIDQILIITSTAKPPFKSGLLDRYLIIADKNDLKAIICINKTDLASIQDFEIYRKEYAKLGYPVLFVSAIKNFGIEKLKQYLKNKVTLLVGHSGVGKSSLINAIEPQHEVRTQSVSEKTRKGLHTTSSVQLFPLSFGGFAGDTPGIRELGLWNLLRKDLKYHYKEIDKFAVDCQFADCNHTGEPGCAVKKAVDKSKIFSERYRNYLNIFASLKSASYE
jgi:ribosome biogenesis GTPase